MGSKIEWCDEGWPVVTGCSPVSEGCRYCWAARYAATRGKHLPQYKGLAFQTGDGYRWTGEVRCHEELLGKPLHWRKPRRIFVCPMSDLFHPEVPFEFITKVFDVMCSWRWPSKAAEREGDMELLVDPGHTYQVLTKRPEQIEPWLEWVANYWPGDSPFNVAMDVGERMPANIWLGTSVSTQDDLDKQLPHLRKCPAAVRFISVEPMLEPMVLDLDGIDWVILGCESGPKRRPCGLVWMLFAVEQCDEAGVPVFVKQVSVNGRVSHNPAEWPGYLRRREWPTDGK